MKFKINIDVCYSQAISPEYKFPEAEEGFLLTTHNGPSVVVTLDDEVLSPMKREVSWDDAVSNSNEVNTTKDRINAINANLDKLKEMRENLRTQVESKMERKEGENFRDFAVRISRTKEAYDRKIRNVRIKRNELLKELKEIERGEKDE